MLERAHRLGIEAHFCVIRAGGLGADAGYGVHIERVWLRTLGLRIECRGQVATAIENTIDNDCLSGDVECDRDAPLKAGYP